MSQELFRQEAIEHQGERLKGSFILSQPISYSFLSLFITLLTLLAIIFLYKNDYSRKQEVYGYLMPDQGLISVSAPRGGRLLTLSVKQNQVVEQGSPLFKVQVEQTVNGNELISEQALQNVEVQEQQLRQRIRLELKRNAVLEKQFEGRRLLIQNEVKQNTMLLESEQGLLEIKKSALDRAKILLQQGLLSNADFDGVKSAFLLQQANSQKHLFLIEEREAELREITLEQESAVLTNQSNISILETNLVELQGQHIRLTGENINHILSPAKGKIANINNKVGQVVGAREQVVAIIPQGSSLQAELYIPSRAIGFLKENQQVSIRYESFPYQKFGVQKAHIISLSTVVIFPEELPQNLALNEPVYRVIASLDSQFVKAFGNDIPLRSGMVLSADVLLEERSLFEWLLEPLFSISGKG